MHDVTQSRNAARGSGSLPVHTLRAWLPPLRSEVPHPQRRRLRPRRLGLPVACSSSGVAAGGATAGTTGRRLHTARARADSAAAQLLATTRPRWLARGVVGCAVHRPAGAVTRYIRRSRCLHSRLCSTIVRLMEASVQALHEASEALKCNIRHMPTSADIRLLLEVNVTIAELALKQREHARDERTRSQAPRSSGAPGGAQRDTDTRS